MQYVIKTLLSPFLFAWRIIAGTFWIMIAIMLTAGLIALVAASFASFLGVLWTAIHQQWMEAIVLAALFYGLAASLKLWADLIGVIGEWAVDKLNH